MSDTLLPGVHRLPHTVPGTLHCRYGYGLYGAECRGL